MYVKQSSSRARKLNASAVGGLSRAGHDSGEDALPEADAEVYFVCEREASKLRVRITSAGYNRHANCQFPRAIRAAGGIYKAPATAVTFARGARGTVFYRVKANEVEAVNDGNNAADAGVNKVFGDDDDDSECCVCMDTEREQVFIPCGHYCCCGKCSKALNKCPICRTAVTDRVNREEIWRPPVLQISGCMSGFFWARTKKSYINVY